MTGSEGAVPILALHSALLPLNVLRLREIRSVINAVNAASTGETLDSLIPYMRSESHPAGETLFRKDEVADKFGEVGLFAPQSVRSVSAVCEEDCLLHAITKDKVLELYYQDPRFGFFLIRTVSALVQESG